MAFHNEVHSAEVCASCKLLAADIVFGRPSRTPDRWLELNLASRHLFAAVAHHDSTVAALIHSAFVKRCRSCSIIADVLGYDDGDDVTDGRLYGLFIQSHLMTKCEFFVTALPVLHFEDARRLELFGLRAAAEFTRLPELENEPLPYGPVTQPKLAKLFDVNPASQEAMDVARNWLDDCVQNHITCVRDKKAFPTRLVDLSKVESSQMLKIHFTAQGGEEGAYAALSYNWGEDRRLELHRNETIGGLSIQASIPPRHRDNGGPESILEDAYPTNAIPLAAFPQTYRDAFKVAQALGFRYIWIDQLCIVQNWDSDFNEQVANMANIYGNTSLVISAASSLGTEQGFLKPVKLKQSLVGIGTFRQNLASNEIVEVYLAKEMPGLDLEQKHISTRGWVFQERLVSPASLHYTDEGIIWECARHGTMSTLLAHDQEVSAMPWKACWRRAMREGRSMLAKKATTGWNPPRGRDRTDPRQLWFEWMSAYCARSLYVKTDKLPAIAGVAKAFQETFDFGDYIAGLWKDDILAGLTWKRDASVVKSLQIISSDDEYVGPSWSWISVEGRLTWNHVRMQVPVYGPMMNIQDIVVENHEPGSFQKIKPWAMLKVRAQCQEIQIDRQTHPGSRQRPHQECLVSKGFANSDNVLCLMDQWSENLPRYQDYLCMRIGGCRKATKSADSFLILESIHGRRHHYRRVGVIETDAWYYKDEGVQFSGCFVSPSIIDLVLV